MNHWESRLVPGNNSSLISLPEAGYFRTPETRTARPTPGAGVPLFSFFIREILFEKTCLEIV